MPDESKTTLDTALAHRAVACAAWQFVPGMLMLEDGSRHLGRWNGLYWWTDRAEEGCEIFYMRGPEDMLPDLDDSATLGCLLALVRGAWSDPNTFVLAPGAVGGWLVLAGAAAHTSPLGFGRRYCGPPGRAGVLRPVHGSEAEALVSALELAPAKGQG